MAGPFREKSLEHMSSPDRLDDYIQVSSPGSWLVLIVIALLLGAALVWGAFGRIDDTRDALIIVGRSGATCYVDSELGSGVSRGDAVVVDGVEGTISSVGDSAVPASSVEEAASYAAPQSGWYTVGVALIDLEPGVYEGTVTVESYEPFQLLLGAA